MSRVWLAAAIVAALLQWLSPHPLALAWDRHLLDQDHQWWRLLSGPWIHLSWTHLGLNLAGLAIVLAMFVRLTTPLSQAVALLAIGVVTCLLLWLLFPATQWMVGLSGPLHGLFAWSSLRLAASADPAPGEAWWRGPKFGWVLLAGLAVKLLLENAISADPQQAQWLGGPVLMQAHQAGTIAGLMVAAVDAGWQRWRAGRPGILSGQDPAIRS